MVSLTDYFGFDEYGTDTGTELKAGVTTFLTMSYVVVVNPNVLAAGIQIEGGSAGRTVQMIAVVTIISAALATLITAVYANRPFAQAPGLGLNAFFAFVVVGTLGVPWQTALAAVVAEGILFVLLTVGGAREYVIRLFPTPVKKAVGAGIGLFLAIIGLQAMRVTAADEATLVTLSPVLAADPVAVISVAGLILTAALYVKRVPGAIVIGILATTAVSCLASFAGYAPFGGELPPGNTLYEPAGLVGRTTIAYDPAAYDIAPLAGAFLEGLGSVDPVTFLFVLVTFFFVDFFDTAGTLTGVGQAAGFLDEDGNLPEIEKPLLADAIGTTVGGMLGTSTVTTYIESSTGIDAGGRTGMTALVVAGLFVLSLAFVPLAAAVPIHASHLALVVVGILMLGNVTEIDWNDATQAVPAGLTILVMPFTFSIATGIAAGIVSYPFVNAFAGDRARVRLGH